MTPPTGKLLQTITIPRYLTRIKIAEARRALYYRPKDKAKIPKKYADCTFNKKGFLVDENGVRIISNPRVAGTPRWQPISGNRFTSGYSSPFLRNQISGALKDHYRPFVKSMRPITLFPIYMEWEFHTTVDTPNFDLSNFWFYLKYFEDTMIDEGIIPDDSIEFITRAAAPILVPVLNFGARKFVFRFFHDDRSLLKQFEPWNPAKTLHTNGNSHNSNRS